MTRPSPDDRTLPTSYYVPAYDTLFLS